MGHYFDEKPNSISHKNLISVNILDTKLIFQTDNGVFSKRGLDFGTRSLLENISSLKGEVLDLGCGYGPIGIYLSKRFNVNVDMIDINERSVALAKENAILNKVNVNIFLNDGLENITKTYNYIITNPPIRVGKEKLYYLLDSAMNHLKKSGELWLVINKDQGAKSLINNFSMEYNVEVVIKNKGFYVIKMQK